MFWPRNWFVSTKPIFRRRTKVIPHVFGEKPLLKLMYASILLASETWRNLSVSEFETRQLESIRLKQNERFEKNYAPVIVQKSSRSPVRFSSKKGLDHTKPCRCCGAIRI